ncbi:hypothetical protein LTR99_010366 [Exophiala xenobiotica]|uniref:Ysc84 actin-binding domain-containing protein n=1 Tax=Vermiconidia calcicola TaxID=1690605 RepID=A0AAV9Q220_9PEZI|nr:hypothetical protein LTR72_007787 [Exophiala xenobiotica]KAK5534085.1 hypothetical protein LTR25_007065 [Vermiconidia calcicola]KAK5538126.1 hypothetical protein LTR23_007263 [Chaetothyriales sp. CCFEE 6169]KAK5264076.1 hypothetical protein LTR96_010584 [Exophiala xenobiotica]KAK5285974.1 hypothetical protein LTR14_010495 [Exophiala xenobiotica]
MAQASDTRRPISATPSNSNSTVWEKTKGYSSTAYEKALKPGFNKAYSFVNKLEKPVNRLSNKVGSEAFWPTSLDKESEKAARILRGFCKDGFYEQIDEQQAKKIEERNATVEGTPQGKQRVLQKIPAKVIKNCVGLAIFTTMRTGWLFGGSGGAGVLVARHPETHEWSPPSGIQTQNMSFGFLAGVDIYDSILVINSYKALEAFTKLRCTLGTEVGVAAGPIGMGGSLDTELVKRQSPIWSYVKSRGLYAGVALEGNLVIERTDENERFYGERVGVADILVGKVRYPPVEKYQVLLDTLRAAQGEDVDESLLPEGEAPSDMELITDVNVFGIPAEDDPDPYGVKALEAEGLAIREAGTHQRPSAEVFEFRPSPTSPIYAHFSRKSVDGSIRSRTWRDSTHSLASVDRATQTNEAETDVASRTSPGESTKGTETSMKHSQTLDDENDEHDEQHEQRERSESFSDVDSDAEIHTAVPVVARARVVEVQKRPPPALPPRNPERVASPTSMTTSVDGFDRISLNGTAEETHEGGRTMSPTLTHDNAGHSAPVTPNEERTESHDIPGSFN